ncbi:hypothetical protein MTO96_031331 [Rhipicephalus appendiculatus]
MSLFKCVQPHRGAPSPGVATRISCCTDLQRTLPLRMEQLAKLRPMSSWFFPRLATHQFHPRATPVTPQATPSPAEATRYPMRNGRPPDRLQTGL